ncbi:ABC-F family ATP-binding cassette domain-containing protein [Verrucomicrobium spinosum]|uniref:ABC-F family ATP-binding cassette domain-containing protein n=2 Tax=Verrucomicrobium spinosum TaxID=2736 RepID=UPI0001745B17|nr:ABC-F family ATP-binding cassette domain-containing protein [Verrucomicrobium spinosum]
MLTLRNVTKSFNNRVLFKDASMTINYAERVALVGPNGAGKSTLFSLILKNDTPDAGEIERDEWTTIGYLRQEAEPTGNETILDVATGKAGEMERLEAILKKCEASGDVSSMEYLEAHSQHEALHNPQAEAKAKKILKGFGFKDVDQDRPARELSGGWIMRAHLTRLLVIEPDLLLLDEPTNHLDLMSLLWFRNYLKNYPGAILLISHDRDFMDEIIETTYDIDEGKLIAYTGNYSDHVKQKEEAWERATQAYRNQQKEIEHIQEFIDKFRSVASKASQAQSREKQLAKMEKLEKPKPLRKAFRFNFPQPTRIGQRAIGLEGIHQAYGEKKVYNGLDLDIERGERTVLVGPNGAGKSTLLKIMAGVVPFQKGERRLGANAKLGYFSQHRADTLDPEKTILDEVRDSAADLRDDDIRAILGSFLFKREDVFKKTKVLSGGEKSRLNLVKFLVNPPNLLLMDEPTTHLDIWSIEGLILALQRFEGTLVFISHDVHFIRTLATKVLHINAGQVTAFAGDYDYYLEKSGMEEDARAAAVL